MPLLADESLERCVWRTVQAEAEKCKCTVLAIGGMPDHVHLVLVQPPTITLAKLLNQIKGVSSSVARENLGSEQFFRWANGYAAFSLSRPHCKEAIAYVLRQKEHHADQNLWQHWEWTPQHTPQAPPPPWPKAFPAEPATLVDAPLQPGRSRYNRDVLIDSGEHPLHRGV